MENDKKISVLESILFVSGEPVKKSKILKLLEIESEELESLMKVLIEKYALAQSGLSIITKGEEIQLVSKADNVDYIESLVKNELQDSLSGAAMEVASIIAYRGPISKPEIEQIRGVNCSYTVRNLLLRGLIEKNDNPRDSRGYVYSITFDFLKKMGINDVKQLPNYDILSVDNRINFAAESGSNEQQDIVKGVK